MYKIGWVSLSESFGGRVEQLFSKDPWVVRQVKIEDDFLSRLEAMDMVFIEEQEDHVVEICELILKVRSNVSGFLWVITANSHKKSRRVYMQIGADGVWEQSLMNEEMGLFLKRLMERIEVRSSYKVPKRRTEKNDSEQPTIRLIPSNYSVLINGAKEIGLTKMEFKTLELLLKHPKQALTYEKICQTLWGTTGGKDKQYRVSNMVFHLRKKVEQDASSPRYIKSVRSKGYMLDI